MLYVILLLYFNFSLHLGSLFAYSNLQLPPEMLES